MTPKQFLSKLDASSKPLLTAIHNAIIKHDKKVDAKVQGMMGKEMICYCEDGVFKYAVSRGKSHMSLHIMPMYASPALHNKYSAILTKAKFQKGCINFKNAEQMPVEVVAELIKDSASVDYSAIVAMYKKKKK